MRTRSQSRNSNRQQQQVPPTFVEPFNLVKPIENQAPPVVTMADNHTMAQLLEAPTEDKENPHGSHSIFQQITLFYDEVYVRRKLGLMVVNWVKPETVPTKVSASNSTPGISLDVAKLKDMVKALLLDKKNQTQTPAPVKAVEESCVTCGVSIIQNCPATDGNVHRDDIQEVLPPEAVLLIKDPRLVTTTHPLLLLKTGCVKTNRVTKDIVPPTNNGSTKDVQPPVVQVQPHVPNSEPVVAPVSALMPNPKPSIPYPSRLNDQKIREKANNQIEKFYQIFQDLHFEISFADALILMPKFASTLKSLIGNKEKLSEI
ncbi:hypothetical protein Tco_0783887 [Tanacetum coccineum]